MYEKMKSESYLNFGGMNLKASPYATGPHEFLNLVNFDFSSPGAITQRWGSTQHVNVGGAINGQITGLYQFERLNGISSLIFSDSHNVFALWKSADGTSNVIAQIATSSGSPTNLYDFVTFVDRLFFCNGVILNKFSGASIVAGTTTTTFGLPLLNTAGPTYQITGLTALVGTGATGLYNFGVGFKNDLGFYGPICQFNGVSLGASQGILAYAYVPDGFGIQTVVSYTSNPNGTPLFLQGEATASIGTTNTILIYPGSIQSSSFEVPINVIGFTFVPKYIELYNNQLYMAGFTSYSSRDPFSGVSSTLNYQSTLWWSEIGKPEWIEATFFAEVRTNDADRITCLKAYNNSLLVFKQRSFFQLFATSATDISINQVSDQYGCVSNRAAVVFNQTCYFLDKKGICEFNGSNVQIVSSKVESVFQRMNQVAAIDNSSAIHFKKRNEVWFNIPVDGSTLINMTVVYDYLMNAWTTFQGFYPASMNIAISQLSDFTSFYGDYSGVIYAFGTSLPSDNGNGITLIASTYFHHDLGDSVEKQWRRLFLNVEPITGNTATINVNLLANYGSSVTSGVTMYLNPFQNRIDFGISAKSLQAQFTSYSATLYLKIYGYTIESRFQRKV